MYNIYSIGDGNFLYTVFNAISLMCYGESGSSFSSGLMRIYSISALLGFVWLLVQTIMTQKPLNLGSYILAWIIFTGLFVPKAEVSITDLQTQQVRQIDNVPLIVGVSGNIISSVGKAITNQFENFFYNVGGLSSGDASLKNGGGYLGYLSLIMNARRKLEAETLWSDIDARLCNYLSYCTVKSKQSFQNYMTDCGAYLTSGLANVKESTITSFEKFKYTDPNVINGTYVCSVAWSKLNGVLQQADVKNVFMSYLTDNYKMEGEEKLDTTTRALTNEKNLNNAIKFLTGGNGSSTAYDYVAMTALRPLYNEGIVRFESWGSESARAAIMLKQAQQQRDIQWGAEQSMFENVMRPAITFFEGFVYAITPLMPFFLFFGMGGLHLIGKYFMLIMWVQLWQPCLAICNFYIETTVAQKLSGDLINTALSSYAGMDTALEEIQHWVAIGGLLAASIPFLSLFILTGSVYTFNSIAGRMVGGDFVNEKAVSPDVVQHAPMINNSVGAQTWNATSHGVSVGSESLFKNYNWSAISQQSVSSAQSVLNGQSSQFVGQYQMATSHTKSFKDAKAYNDSFTDGVRGNSTQAVQDARSFVTQWAEKNGFNLSTAEINQVTSQVMRNDSAAINANGSVSHSSKKLNAGVGISFGVSGQKSIGSSHALGRNLNQGDMTQLIADYGDSGSKNKVYSDGSSYASELANIHQASDSKAFDTAYGAGSNAAISNSGSEVISSTKQFNQLASFSNNQSSTKSISSYQAASMISDDELNILEAKAKNEGTFGEVERRIIDRAEQLQAGGLGNEDMCKKAAYFEYYADKGDLEVFAMLGGNYTEGSVTSSNAYQNSNLKTPDISKTTGVVNREMAQTNIYLSDREVGTNNKVNRDKNIAIDGINEFREQTAPKTNDNENTHNPVMTDAFGNTIYKQDSNGFDTTEPVRKGDDTIETVDEEVRDNATKFQKGTQKVNENIKSIYPS